MTGVQTCALPIFKNAKVQAIDKDSAFNTTIIKSSVEGFVNYYEGGYTHNSFICFKNFDLSNINNISIRTNSKDANGKMELRLDSSTGKVVASFPIKAAGAWEKWSVVNAPLKPTNGFHNLYFVFVHNDPTSMDAINFNWMQFNKAKGIVSLK